jgi:hypothetical protein
MLLKSLYTSVLILTPGLAFAQGQPTQSQLDEISARGRALAGYQRAAWNASAQLMAMNPAPVKVQRYVAYHADSGWVVAFGTLNTERDTFYVSYIAIPAAVNGRRVDSLFEFKEFPEPGPDTDFLVRASNAIDNAVLALGATNRPYTAAAIPAENGDWLVYLMPAPNLANEWPLGDDVRFRFSADAERLLETRRRHAASAANNVGGKTLATERHRTSLNDQPEDSDVFHVLMRRPQVPAVVATTRQRFSVDVDGSIKIMQGKEPSVGTSR